MRVTSAVILRVLACDTNAEEEDRAYMYSQHCCLCALLVLIATMQTTRDDRLPAMGIVRPVPDLPSEIRMVSRITCQSSHAGAEVRSLA